MIEEKKVFSITINGKNDCVVMTEEEASLITLKYSHVPDYEIVDMTERHSIKPQHLHKLERAQYYPGPDAGWTWTGPLPQAPWKKGVGPGQWGGAAHCVWEFEDLMDGDYV